MATRTSFRPRPLDIHKQLPIVRELDQLDSTDGLVSREITHNHAALDKENEEVGAPRRLNMRLQSILSCQNIVHAVFVDARPTYDSTCPARAHQAAVLARYWALSKLLHGVMCPSGTL